VQKPNRTLKESNNNSPGCNPAGKMRAWKKATPKGVEQAIPFPKKSSIWLFGLISHFIYSKISTN
jgi:hypothetical protein